MKLLLLIVLLLGSIVPPAQASLFQYGQLRYVGLRPHYPSRAALVGQLGQPLAASRPRYECGQYADEAGKRYTQLRFGQADYIGSAAKGYDLETLRFVPGGASLRYGTHTWDAHTTLASIRALFGDDARLTKRPDGTEVVSIWVAGPTAAQSADVWVELSFRNGRLVRFNTGEPC